MALPFFCERRNTGKWRVASLVELHLTSLCAKPSDYDYIRLSIACIDNFDPNFAFFSCIVSTLIQKNVKIFLYGTADELNGVESLSVFSTQLTSKMQKRLVIAFPYVHLSQQPQDDYYCQLPASFVDSKLADVKVSVNIKQHVVCAASASEQWTAVPLDHSDILRDVHIFV